MKAYKGFNKDMTCRGFQFKEGETYTEDKAVLCKSGFHACERPLDVFNYYAPGSSVYHEVELDDVCEKRESDDTKICGKSIKIGAAVDVKGLIKAQFEYVKAHCTGEYTDPKIANAGNRGAANSRGSAEVGEGGVAVARGEAGYGNKVRGKMGAILVIAQEEEDSYEIASWAVGVVDGVSLKPDVWYKLVDGEFVEAEG